VASDPWLRLDDDPVMTLPLAGHPGHGKTASLRRQPGSIVDGRPEGGNTGKFELICGQCADHPYLDYSEIPPRLQRIRGPYLLQAGLAAYEKHLGLDMAADESGTRSASSHGEALIDQLAPCYRGPDHPSGEDSQQTPG